MTTSPLGLFPGGANGRFVGRDVDTILVTGGAGFIGGCFVRQWIAHGRGRVVNVDRLSYAGNLESLSPVLDAPEHVFVREDIADAAAVERIFAEYEPHAVIHFAAETHVDRSIEDPSEFLRTNVQGTFNLLEASRRLWGRLSGSHREAFRFLHVSTDEVFGSAGDGSAFTEATPYDPSSPYSASKAAADHFVRAWRRTYGLPVLLTNCSNNYGPCQYPEKLIPLIVLNALEGKPLPVYGDGGNVRDWLFVEDHCEALRLVLDRGEPGRSYNIGGNCERTNLDIVRAVCAAVDELKPGLPHAPCERLITHVADRPGHDRRYAIDATRIREELGWRPRHDFASGIRATVQWYLENRQWVARLSNTDARQRLGLLRKGA